MKKILKGLWSGFIVTITALLLAAVVWAFFTLALVLAVVTSPILVVVATHWSCKIESLKDFAENFLDDLERVIEDAEDDLP